MSQSNERIRAFAARARFVRQTKLPGFGPSGQAALASARVLLVGAGGLGSPAALYLAAAGVRTLGLIDDDRVDETNLHRQVLYGAADAGRPKLEVAAERLRAIDPELEFRAHPGRLSAGNARSLVRDYDVVLDGTDNFPARYSVNDACVLEGRVNVHGAVQGFEGQVSVFGLPDGPCYRCLFPEPPEPGSVPSCSEVGVLGPVPGLVGVWQAIEAVKLIAGVGEPLAGRMLRIDTLAGRVRTVALRRDPGCPLCGERPRITDVVDVRARCEATPEVELPFDIGVEELARRRETGEAPTVLDVRLAEELAVARLDGDVVHLPLHVLPARTSALDPGREYAVLCHHGTRSWQAVQFLRARGFTRARNVEGGIDRWSAVVDPSVPRY